MTDYRAVMTLLLGKRSYRQIEDQLGCSHRAISRANQALRSLGLTTAQQVAALTNDELDEIFVDKRTSGQGEFVPIDFDAVVKARTASIVDSLHHRPRPARPAALQLRPVPPAGCLPCRCGRAYRPDHSRTRAYDASGLGRDHDAPVRPFRHTG